MKTFFSCLLAVAQFCVAAQKNAEPFRFTNALTVNPTLLIATDNTAMIGAEHRFPHRLSAVLDAGYIFGTYYVQNNQFKDVSGFALRPGLKWYDKTLKGFFQFQLAYKQVNYKVEDWLGKDCVNGTPSYEQFQTFTYRKTAFSANVLAGELFRITESVFVELYLGFGVKERIQAPTEKNACYNRFTEFGGAVRRKMITGNVPVGFKAVVALN